MAEKGRTKKFRFKKMGGINTMAEDGALLPFGATGLSLTELQRKPDLPLEFRNIENFNPTNRGGKTKTFGFSGWIDLGANPVSGLFRFIQKDGTTFFLATSGTKLYKIDTTPTQTEIGTDEITTGSFPDFTIAYDKCVICDGGQAPKKFDGTTISALGGSPPAQAKQALFLRDRLFVFGSTADPSLLYYSDAGGIEAGYASNFINCDVNDGEKITSISHVFLPGQLDPVILVGKERSVGVVTGDGTAGNAFTYFKIKLDNGMPSHRASVQFGQDVAFLTNNGVSSYKTDVADVNLQQRDLSEDVQNKFDDLNSSAIDDSLAWHDPERTRISFAVPESGFSAPNVIWHYDTLNGFWYKERYGNEKIMSVLIDTDGVWYHGNDAGQIFKHLTTDKSFDGAAINAKLELDFMDFFEPHRYKRILEARATIRGNGAYAVGVSNKFDFKRLGKANSLDLTEPSYVWGGGTWTTDSGVYQWGASPIELKKFIPSGYFRNLKQEFTNANADEPVDIFDLEYLVEYMDRR